MKADPKVNAVIVVERDDYIDLRYADGRRQRFFMADEVSIKDGSVTIKRKRRAAAKEMKS